MTYSTDFAILRAVEKSSCPSKHFYTKNCAIYLTLSRGMQYATKTELLWWTIVVMGRRTSPSSCENHHS
nr:MAG TPA: hypothetical protein [Caudoviricetes sp.]